MDPANSTSAISTDFFVYEDQNSGENEMDQGHFTATTALSGDIFVYGDESSRDGNKAVGSKQISDQTVMSVNNTRSDGSDQTPSKPRDNFFEEDLQPAPKKQKTDRYEYGFSDNQDRDASLKSNVEEGDGILDGQRPQAGDSLFHGHKMNDSSTQGADETTELSQTISELLKGMLQQDRMVMMQWGEVLQGSENFEKFSTVRLDRILQDAKRLEENLKQQKNMLCQRLKGLSKTLKMTV